MKNKIIFGGVMAAILISATGANAAQIASKDYVDAQNATQTTNITNAVSTVLEDYSTTNEMNTAITNATSTITADVAGKEDVSNKSGSIATDTGSTTKYTTVKAVEDHVASANATQTTNILNAVDTTLADYSTTTEMNTAITNATSTITADVAGKEDLTNKSTNIATDTGSDTKYTTVKAVETFVAGAVSDAVDAVNTDISGKEDVTNKSNNITTDTGSTTKYTTVKAVETYAIPKPGANCMGAQAQCVLSIDKGDGSIYWADVTMP